LQVLDSVVDGNSPAWNGESIYISRDGVGASYLSQFRKDFSAFLAARAENLKEQGAIGHISHHMEAAFNELIREVIYSCSSAIESTALSTGR